MEGRHKLAQLITEGSKHVKQCKGDMFAGDSHACALGMAFIGSYPDTWRIKLAECDDEEHRMVDERLGELLSYHGMPISMVSMKLIIPMNLQDLWWQNHHDSYYFESIMDVISFLNDIAGLTPDEIASWLTSEDHDVG